MDEPTSALGARYETLLKTIVQIKARGVAVLFVSHKFDEILRVAEHIVVLRNGRKVFDERQTAPKREELVRHMVGRELREGGVRAKSKAGSVLLKMRGLSRSGYYRDVSFELRAGEILGVTAPASSISVGRRWR